MISSGSFSRAIPARNFWPFLIDRQMKNPPAKSDHSIPENWLAIDAFRLALTLLSEGFSVIPLLPDGKKPARKWKQYQETFATTRELAEWFVYSDCVPAIVTGSISGITVIDCDSPDAIEAATSLNLCSDMSQATKRGRHYVFAHQGERNTVRVMGVNGIDRRGEGGYVKAYPDSIHWRRELVTENLEPESVTVRTSKPTATKKPTRVSPPIASEPYTREPLGNFSPVRFSTSRPGEGFVEFRLHAR